MSNPIIIDLSHHNPEPDWAKLKANGTIGVIHKATEGTTYIDPTFAGRRERARAAGIIFASYHFLKHGNAERQMLHYLDVVGPVKGERMVIDHEDAKGTLDDLVTAVEALARQPLNLQITVYSGHTIKEQLGNDREQLLADFTSLWIAHYTSADEPKWPTATWPVWSLWQYTDKAKVAGVSQPVDGNRFNGPAASAARWLSPAGAAPGPAVVEPVVTLDVTVPEGVRVDIKVNGLRAA